MNLLRDNNMRLATAILLLAASFGLAACGSSDDVEINLPFVGNIMAKANSKDAKVAPRAGLVLPPKVAALPEPVSKDSAPAAGAWPVDPDQKAKKEAEIAAAKQAEYEKHGDWKGERKDRPGSALDHFKDNLDWSRRQRGVFKKWMEKKAGE
jgi:hypothetical protein